MYWTWPQAQRRGTSIEAVGELCRDGGINWVVAVRLRKSHTSVTKAVNLVELNT
jgi:hypothetical protein